MEHKIIYKNKDEYASFPLLKQGKTGRLLLFFFSAPVVDHAGVFDWNVLGSKDEGETWKEIEFSMGVTPPRTRYDRTVLEMPTGIDVFAGSLGYKRGRKTIHRSTTLMHMIEWDNETETNVFRIPNAEVALTFPRSLVLDDGLVLIPAYFVSTKYENKQQGLVWRSEDHGKTFRLWNMFPVGLDANEMAFIDTKHGILCHIRDDDCPYILESWSDDRGKTWTHPTIAQYKIGKDHYSIIGEPSHLLRLEDGRLLCSYGYRLNPMGIKAVLSDNDGKTWDMPITLRKDAGFCSSLHKPRYGRWWKPKPDPKYDVGYPVSVQLKDGSILTAYYITCKDRITHIATTKWRTEAHDLEHQQ